MNSEFETKAALVVGISQYQHQESFPTRLKELRYSHADAILFKSALLQVGFSADEVRLMLNEEATSHNIRNHLEALDLRPRKSGMSLFVTYFSGHGYTEYELGEYNHYLLSHDARFSSGRLDSGSALSTQKFAAGLKAVPAREKVVIVDACHAGNIPMNHSHLAQDMVLLAACSGAELSWENQREKHGVFTLRLVEAMCGMTSTNKGGEVTVAQIMDHLQRTVPGDAIALGGTQNPYSVQHGRSIILGRDLATFIQGHLNEPNRQIPIWARRRAQRLHD